MWRYWRMGGERGVHIAGWVHGARGRGGVLFWALCVDGVLDLRLEPGSGFFWPFAGWGVRLMGCVSSRELGPCARLVSRGLSCWEASVTTYLQFRF